MSGEGDTQGGSQPMVTEKADCPVFQRFVDAIGQETEYENGNTSFFQFIDRDLARIRNIARVL